MTDLKPRRGCCGYCVSCIGAENCRQCGATLRPAPELPEGYQADENTLFVTGHSRPIAEIDEEGDLLADCGPEHFQALAIWLQRRLHADA